jgi:pyruvate formate lyase activating enzyme
MQQPDFTAAVLAASREEGFHTALDTSGYAPWEEFEKVLPSVNLVLYDFKLADAETHRTYTGVSNEIIQENLRRIDGQGIPIEIRIPVIPDINDDQPNIDRTAEFLSGLRNLTQVTLLPYHGLGESKYPRIGRSYRLNGKASPSRERMEEIAGWIARHGLTVHAR